MFRVTFSNIDRKLLKSMKRLKKALKSKKGHSLYKAEKLLEEFSKVIDEPAKITITITDIDNELKYIFEDIIINASSKPELMDILGNEILSSGHENAQKIISAIEKSYRDEMDLVDNEETINEDKNINNKGKGIKEKIFNFLKKEDVEDNFTDDFADLKGIDFEDINKDNIENDFSNGDNIECENDFSNRDNIECENDFSNEDNIECENDFNNEDNIEYEDNFSNEDNIEYENNIENEENIVIYNSEDNLINEDLTISHNTNKTSEQVVFPSYDSYLDLSLVNNMITRSKNRLDKNNLVKFLGLNVSTLDEAVTELDSVKLSYALSKLDDTKFVLIRDYFHNEVEGIKDEIQTKLSQAYEHSMAFDYDNESKKILEEDFDNLIQEKEATFSKYTSDQEEEYNLKLEKFDHEQEKALEEFRKQQKLERNIYVKELDTKKYTAIDLYKNNMQNELNSKKEELIENKKFELKNQFINELIETKRLSIRNMEEQIDNVIDNIWDKTQNALTDLKNDIEVKVPSWKEDIEEKRRIEAEKREEQRKQEELKIEKERIELQRKQLELEQSSKKEDDEDILHSIQKRFEEYEEKLNNLSRGNQEKLTSKDIAESKEKKNISTKFIIPGIIVTIFALSCGIFAGKMLNKDTSKETEMEMKYKELTGVISQIEEKLNNPAIETGNEESIKDLETLLKDKNYEKAMSLYRDSESLAKIEKTLYQNNDLAMLITFNKTNETTFGKIDEAILSKDVNKVLEIYKEMSDEIRKQLSNEQKSDIALLLYQKGEKELAGKLLEN